MPRWFKITLWIVLGLVVLSASFMAWLIHGLRNIEWDFSKADLAHYEASEAFYADLEGAECVTQDMVVEQADLRDWDWLVEPTFEWESCPAAASPWLRVTVRPSLFMSTDNENAAFFVFDAQGCSIDWRVPENCGR